MKKFFIYYIIFLYVTIINTYANSATIYVSGGFFGVDSPLNISKAKVASFIKKQKKQKKDVIFLNTGSSIYGNMLDYNNSARYTFYLLHEMQVDVLNLGIDDLHYEESKFKFKIGSIYSDLMISSNLLQKNGSLFFPDYYILNKNNLKIAVLGVMSSNKKLNYEDFYIVNPVTQLQKKIAEIREKKIADVIIVLSSLEGEEFNNLISINGADFIINGSPISNDVSSYDFIDNKYIIKVSSNLKELIKIEIDNQQTKIDVLLKKDFEGIIDDKKVVSLTKNYTDLLINSIPFKKGITKKTFTNKALYLGTNKKHLEFFLEQLSAYIHKNENVKHPIISIIAKESLKRSVIKKNSSYLDVFQAFPFDEAMLGITIDKKNFDLIKDLSISIFHSELDNIFYIFGEQQENITNNEDLYYILIKNEDYKAILNNKNIHIVSMQKLDLLRNIVYKMMSENKLQ